MQLLHSYSFACYFLYCFFFLPSSSSSAHLRAEELEGMLARCWQFHSCFAPKTIAGCDFSSLLFSWLLLLHVLSSSSWCSFFRICSLLSAEQIAKERKAFLTPPAKVLTLSDCSFGTLGQLRHCVLALSSLLPHFSISSLHILLTARHSGASTRSKRSARNTWGPRACGLSRSRL